MEHRPTTLTHAQLHEAMEQAVRRPHKHINKGRLVFSPDIYTSPDRETNILISRFSLIDCTGSIHIGPWCNIAARSRIYTHDHIILGKAPILAMEEKFGVVWQDKYIGADVWIADGAIVLYQVTNIPDGVVVGAGSVLTKNPGPYEIWAGNPAKKIGERGDVDDAALHSFLNRERFRL